MRFAHGSKNGRAAVPAGARLALVVHQGSYGDYAPSVPTFPVLLHAGGGASARTVLVFERGDGAFFEPPVKR